MAAPVAAARGLRVAFNGVEVVKGVDVELFAGEVHAIIGENGAGKSTVAKTLAGVNSPSAGQVLLNGQPVAFGSPRQAIEAGIALIHQEPLTFPDLMVAENIFVGHQPTKGAGIDWPRITRESSELLASIGVKLNPGILVRGLSVADQQMIELASALSHHAKVLIFDETTASLTPQEVGALFAIMKRLKEEGKALAFVSHRLDEVLTVADRITVLRDGEKVAELDPAKTNTDELIRNMVGRSVSAQIHRGAPKYPDSEPVLSTVRLTQTGRFRNISLEARPGRILGLGGLVGAGRTEFCRVLFGIEQPTSGEIRFRGKPTRIGSPAEAMKLGFAMAPEDRQHDGLQTSRSILENVLLSNLRALAPRGWVSAGPIYDQSKRALAGFSTRYRELDQPVRELSGGNQQKVVLAKLLLSKPSMLILDEPTRGVDVGAKEEIHRIIIELADSGVAVIMVSSDLPELLALSDEVVVLRQGQVAGRFDRSNATPESVMAAAAGQVAVAS
jgi:rhamnose transport system ATP-binding protein